MTSDTFAKIIGAGIAASILLAVIVCLMAANSKPEDGESRSRYDDEDAHD